MQKIRIVYKPLFYYFRTPKIVKNLFEIDTFEKDDSPPKLVAEESSVSKDRRKKRSTNEIWVRNERLTLLISILN